jgi:hypothetical protein
MSQFRCNQLSRAVVCFDANAKNQLWNSSFTEKSGSDIENLLSSLAPTTSITSRVTHFSSTLLLLAIK